MTKSTLIPAKIFDLRITQADDPERNEQIVGNAETIGKHLSRSLGIFLGSLESDDFFEMTLVESSTLKKYVLKICN